MRLLASMLFFAPSLAAQLFTLYPVEDATTDASQPTVNFGTSPALDFGKVFSSTGPSYWKRGHVLFDLSPYIGLGLVPTRVTFYWHQSSAQGAGCLDVSLHNVTSPWSESTVTWQTQPTFDPAEVTRECVGDSFALGWKEFDVTSLAQQWLDGTVPNLGFVIRDPMEITAGASRPGLGDSINHANPTVWPYLELDFAVQFGSGCSTHALNPELAVSGGSTVMGQTVDLRAQYLIPGSFGILLLGLSNTTWNGVPLPLPLTALGYPNCDLHVEPLLTLSLGIVPAMTTVPLSIPNVPAFDGQSLYTQVVAFTPATLLEVSNGLGFAVWL